MSTVVLYCWCQSDSASVLLYFTFGSYFELLSKFGAISFQEYVSKGITHPVFYGDLVYKLRRVNGEANFISSGLENSETPSTLSVRPSDHREEYRSCAWPFYSIVQIIP